MGISSEENILKDLFIKMYGDHPSVDKLKGGGSDRQYYRLSSGSVTAIGVISEDVKENDVFFLLDSLLKNHDINVPAVLAKSREFDSLIF